MSEPAVVGDLLPLSLCGSYFSVAVTEHSVSNNSQTRKCIWAYGSRLLESTIIEWGHGWWSWGLMSWATNMKQREWIKKQNQDKQTKTGCVLWHTSPDRVTEDHVLGLWCNLFYATAVSFLSGCQPIGWIHPQSGWVFLELQPQLAYVSAVPSATQP